MALNGPHLGTDITSQIFWGTITNPKVDWLITENWGRGLAAVLLACPCISSHEFPILIQYTCLVLDRTMLIDSNAVVGVVG